MIGFPLLLIPFAIYNVIAFLMPFDWNTKLYAFRLPSGIVFEPTAGDAFIVFSLLMLMFEFIKSTTHGKSLVEHFLGILLAGGAGAEFAMVNPNVIMNQPAAPLQTGNSTFMLFVAICVVDMLAGFAASLRRARRTVAVEQAPFAPVAGASAPAVRAEPARAEPARTEPMRAEPMRAEPARVEPAAHVEPSAERPNPFIKVEPAEKIP
ncbi:MAG: hypothetical protein V7604_4989 [Hyphomicrobiales bacterium]